MCGLCGFLYKDADRVGPVGAHAARDARADGAAAAPTPRASRSTAPPQADSYVVRARIDANHGTPERVAAGARARPARSRSAPSTAPTCAPASPTPATWARSPTAIEAEPDVEVFSIGRAMEIVKDVGDADAVEAADPYAGFEGSHAIGHTRMATESVVDVAHSHPFWARPFPDISVVHNGHITNYHKLRRRLENQGHRFATGNDSEVIAVYIADKLERGESLEDALRASVADLDGTFAYLISTPEGIGVARDPFALKPLALRRVRRGRADRLRGGRDPRRRRGHRARPARAGGRGGALVATLTSEIDCSRHTTREINQAIKRAAADGVAEIHLSNPSARHCLAVAVMQPDRRRLRRPGGLVLRRDVRRCPHHRERQLRLERGREPDVGIDRGARQRRLLDGGDDARRPRLRRRRHRRPRRHLDEGRNARRRRVGRLHVRLHDAARGDDRLRRRRRRHRRLDVRGHGLRRRGDRLARRRLRRGRAGRRRPRADRRASSSRTGSTPAAATGRSSSPAGSSGTSPGTSTTPGGGRCERLHPPRRRRPRAPEAVGVVARDDRGHPDEGRARPLHEPGARDDPAHAALPGPDLRAVHALARPARGLPRDVPHRRSRSAAATAPSRSSCARRSPSRA